MFAPLLPEATTGIARELLDATRRQLGRVPNLYAAMAHSPIALQGYLDFRGALQQGVLDLKMRERVALLVAQLNDCDYCVAAHTFRGGKIGMGADDLMATRRADSTDAKTAAALHLVKALTLREEANAETALTEALQAGWTEAEIGELVAHIALNVFSNYFKQIAHPPLDFPAAPALDVAAA